MSSNKDESESDDPGQRIIAGDCIEAMKAMDADSVHAVVTDPPYGLAFMGRSWDDFKPKEYQEWCEEWASEALRVLKPGGHLIAFSGNRTHHRLFSAVGDAGFTIRDTLTWHHGQGFPKGSDVSKYIDESDFERKHDADAFREYLKESRGEMGLSTTDVAEHFADEGQDPTGCVWNWENVSLPEWEHYIELKDILNLDDRFDELMSKEGADREVVGKHPSPASEIYGNEQDADVDVTAPATTPAEKWNGWKSQLKPATEFAVLARAPMSESAVYRNVLEHGTGALNIDRTRIPVPEDDHKGKGGGGVHERWIGEDDPTNKYGDGFKYKPTDHSTGRYPANLLLDGVAARMLDSQSGECGDLIGTGPAGYSSDSTKTAYGEYTERSNVAYNDSGGASRFFYTAKASKSERTIDGQIENEHPTVKPLDLMEWLVTLVTAPGQRVLDPFAGSGTTIMACKRLNRDGIGIERDEDHADLARKRVELAHEIETDSSAAESTAEETETSDDSGPATLESFGDDD